MHEPHRKLSLRTWMLKRNPDRSWECSGPAWPGFQLQVPALHRAHESHEAGTTGVRGRHSWVMCPWQWLLLIKYLQIPQSRVACSFCPDLTLSPCLSSFSSPDLSEVCHLPPHRSCTPELRSQTMYSPPGHLPGSLACKELVPSSPFPPSKTAVTCCCCCVAVLKGFPGQPGRDTDTHPAVALSIATVIPWGCEEHIDAGKMSARRALP